MKRSFAAALCVALVVCACANPIGRFGSSAPTGRLPRTAVPLHYELELEILPEAERFSGRVKISLELTRELRTLWLHGEALSVTQVSVQEPDQAAQTGQWQVLGPDGVAAVRLPHAIGPGRATLRITYDAPFDQQLRGLYRVEHAGDAYAFTQFEPLSARKAFPCFDEPSWKTPFDVTLQVREGHTAIANTPAESVTQIAEGLERVKFATTRPLPTYLVAFAVGPLDVVAASAPIAESSTGPVPFRGVAARGRGAELAYALAHTPEILASLERYFGSSYPYRKLDVIAVPDFAFGAMENVGAVTFRDTLLLIDAERLSEHQRRSFTETMAHELAHMWFGNLVTMPWWDDLWLNEAFATWLAGRTVQEVSPEQNADMALLRGVLGAMWGDSLESARSIRQPIESNHDVHNAFDGITYQKGAGVLGMFERWLGPEKFRSGIRAYIERHRDGNARTRDLLDSLSSAAGQDIATAFRTFLEQPGVPLLETRTLCEDEGVALQIRQSRYLPLGSQADRNQTWQIPVCARFGVEGTTHESCGLITTRQGVLPLDAPHCPDWVMPNAGAAGYYRFSQSREDLERLRGSSLVHLSAAERYSLADSLAAAFRSGTLPAGTVIAALAPLARDPDRSVATTPIALLHVMRDRLVDAETRPHLEQFVADLYAARLAELGWDPEPSEQGESRMLRSEILSALAFQARHRGVRAEALRRGSRYAGLDGGAADRKALDPDLVPLALRVVVEERGEEVFDTLLEQVFASNDSLERSRRLRALGSTEDPKLAARARLLALDKRLRVNEISQPLWAQAGRVENQQALWSFIEENFDALVERTGSRNAGFLPWFAAGLCSEAYAQRVLAFLNPRIQALDGGPRNLAGSIESIRQCAALVEAQRESARQFFASY